jgi:Zn-dependent metalloprotease
MRTPSWLLLLLLGLILATAEAAADPSPLFFSARARALQALSALRQSGPVEVEWPAPRCQPSMMHGLRVPCQGKTNVDRARNFLTRYAALFADARSELVLLDTQTTRERTVIRFQQTLGKIPVDGAIVSVALDSEGRVRSVGSEALPVSLPSLRAKLSGRQAARRALEVSLPSATPREIERWSGKADLVVLAEGSPRLAYKVSLPGQDPQGRLHLVDALTGEYLGWRRGVLMDVHGLPKEVRR